MATPAAATGSQLHSVAFIGAGTMGGRVATRVMASGFSVTVRDRSEQVQKAFAAKGAALAATPADCASADIVIIFVMDGQQAIDVALGEQGLVHGIDPGRPPTVLIMSTIHPEDAKTIAAGLEAKRAPVLDVPVTGVPAAAEDGQLLLLAGGRDEDVDRVRPVLECMGKKLVRSGPLGSGLTAKILNNMLGTSNLYLMQESYRLGLLYGLAPEVVASILDKGAGQNYYTYDVDRAFATYDVLSDDEEYFPRMMAASLKDWRFAQELADAKGMRLPFVSAMMRAVDDEPGPELRRQWRTLVEARKQSPEEPARRQALGTPGVTGSLFRSSSRSVS